MVTVSAMPVLVWGIQGENCPLPSPGMLVLPLTVVQPPLPPSEVGDEGKYCKDNDNNHRVLHDRGHNPSIHLDIGGQGGF